MQALCIELQQVWRTGIPLAAAMAIEVLDFTDDRLRIQAPLAPNINVHGSAFAGSLYGVCALAGWGLLWLKLRQHSLAGHIVLAEAHINYASPVLETICCECAFDPAQHDRQLERFASAGRAVFELECCVPGPASPAVRFAGRYAIRK